MLLAVKVILLQISLAAFAGPFKDLLWWQVPHGFAAGNATAGYLPDLHIFPKSQRAIIVWKISRCDSFDDIQISCIKLDKFLSHDIAPVLIRYTSLAALIRIMLLNVIHICLRVFKYLVHYALQIFFQLAKQFIGIVSGSYVVFSRRVYVPSIRKYICASKHICNIDTHLVFEACHPYLEPFLFIRIIIKPVITQITHCTCGISCLIFDIEPLLESAPYSLNIQITTAIASHWF